MRADPTRICRTFIAWTAGSGYTAAATVPGRTPKRAGCRSSSRRSGRFPSATWAPSPASTPPTTCGWATSATPGRCAAPRTARACARGCRRRRAGRRHRHRRRHLAAPARGRALGHRGVLAAQALRARRTSTSPSASRACSACPTAARRCCASTTCSVRRAAHLDADDGRGPRRSPPPRPRRHQGLVLRHRRRAQPPAIASTRSTCPASAPLASRPPRPTTPRWFAEHRPRRHGRAGDRARAHRRQLAGRPRGDRGRPARARARRQASACCVRPSPSSGAACTRSCACCAPSSGVLPHRFARGTRREPAPRPVRRPRARSIPASPTSWSTSSSASTARRALASPSSRAARNVYLDRPFGSGGFYPRLAELPARRCSSGPRTTALIPAALRAPRGRVAPRAEQIVVDACGHVPQVERPEQTNGLVQRFFARVDALDVPARRARGTPPGGLRPRLPA